MTEPTPPGARMRWIWLVLAASTAVLVWQYPEQAGVLVSKFNRIALGAALGVAVDRLVFPYSRPNEVDVEDSWMYRRAALMVGGMLAAALAL
jgi:hypothetical protein